MNPMNPTDSSIVVSDLDGTLTTGQTWKGMHNYLIAHGLPTRLFMLRQLPRILLFRLGLVDERNFKERWILDSLHLFKGFTLLEFEQMAKWTVEHELWPMRRQNVIAELEQLQANGHQIIIISGVFEAIINAFVRLLPGFQGIGTAVAFEHNRCTGQIIGSLNVGKHKVIQLQALSHDGKIEAAYGDSKRDIPMLEMSHKPVAVYPDKALRELALKRDWRILEAPSPASRASRATKKGPNSGPF